MGKLSGPKLVTVSCPNHRDLLVNGLWKHFIGQHRTDLSFQHDGKSIRAHRMIVEIFLPPDKISERGASVQQQAPADGNSTEGGLTNGEQDNVTSMLAFMYNGSVTVREDNLSSLREMARGLGFKMLEDAIDLKLPKDDPVPCPKRVARAVLAKPVNRASHSSEDSVERATPPQASMSNDSDGTTSPMVEDGPPTRQPGQKRSIYTMPFEELFPVLRCQFCYFKTQSQILYRQHVKSKHNNLKTLPQPNADGQWECHLCTKALDSLIKLQIHMRGHKRADKYICGICSYHATSPAMLRKHAATHSSDRPHTCDRCGANYKSPVAFRVHMKRHESGDDRHHICETCGRAFNRSDNLKVHLRIHANERPYPCEEPTCGKSFRTRKAMLIHMRIHTDQRPYQCDLCPKAFRQPYTLVCHRRVVHLGEKMPARKRNRKGGNPDEASGHRMRQSDPRPKQQQLASSDEFACTKCPKVMKNHAVLLRHLRQHRLAENPTPGQYLCSLCDKRFKKHGNLTIHLKKAHYALAMDEPTSE